MRVCLWSKVQWESLGLLINHTELFYGVCTTCFYSIVCFTDMRCFTKIYVCTNTHSKLFLSLIKKHAASGRCGLSRSLFLSSHTHTHKHNLSYIFHVLVNFLYPLVQFTDWLQWWRNAKSTFVLLTENRADNEAVMWISVTQTHDTDSGMWPSLLSHCVWGFIYFRL